MPQPKTQLERELLSMLLEYSSQYQITVSGTEYGRTSVKLYGCGNSIAQYTGSFKYAVSGAIKHIERQFRRPS